VLCQQTDALRNRTRARTHKHCGAHAMFKRNGNRL